MFAFLSLLIACLSHEKTRKIAFLIISQAIHPLQVVQQQTLKDFRSRFLVQL